MTPDEYRAIIRAMSLTPVRPSYEGATIHVDADGQHTSIPDPEGLTPDQRVAMIALIKSRRGIVDQ